MSTQKKPSKAPKVPFRLRGIRTEQFATIENAYHEGHDIKLIQNLSFGCNAEKKEIAVLPRYEFHQHTVFMVIGVSCYFNIHAAYWLEWYDPDQQILTIPKQYALHMAVLAVGTTRGVLHAKTEGSPFNRFFLPTWDLTEVIKEDRVVTLHAPTEG